MKLISYALLLGIIATATVFFYQNQVNINGDATQVQSSSGVEIAEIDNNLIKSESRTKPEIEIVEIDEIDNTVTTVNNSLKPDITEITQDTTIQDSNQSALISNSGLIVAIVALTTLALIILVVRYRSSPAVAIIKGATPEMGRRQS